jgi:hypothetical protein
VNAPLPLEPEFRYYLANQDELVARYSGKVLVIKNKAVIGVFDSVPDAVHETAKTQELGTFLVQKCEPGREAYTQVFHSPRFHFQ